MVTDAVAVPVDQATEASYGSDYCRAADKATTAANDSPRLVYGHLGRYGQRLQCPFCGKMVTTRTRDRCDGMTVVFAVLLGLIFWPLCCLPCCLPQCKAVHHYCPKCKNKVGVTEPCS